MPIPRFANQFAIAAPVNVYACTDGCIYGGVLLDTHWKALCALLGREDLAGLRAAERIAQREECNEVLAAWCRERTTATVVAEFTAIGLAVTRVNTYAEAAREEHVRERDMLQPVRLSDGSEVPLTGPAAKFSRTPTRVREAAPVLGQHNAEIYATIGLDADDLARLREDGVI
jgi:crotonobetainyl-CoA:carnitine CoA-transferase CaiB-like acyl-CoA transferase